MPDDDITRMLLDARQGDEGAQERLFAGVYDQLRRLARAQLRRQPGSSMVTTALVHEAFVKLVDGKRVEASDRVHFFALSAHAMRQVLVDAYRRRAAAKRGGAESHLPLEEGLIQAPARGEEILALDEALEGLAEVDPRLVRVVECKFFGGMEHQEIGEALGVSKRTVRRDWLKAKGLLSRALEA